MAELQQVSVFELLEAHEALDVWDDMERKSIAKAEASRRAAEAAR